MRHVSEKLYSMVDNVVTSLGYELVGIELLSREGGGLLRVYIDQERGIMLEDCETVSHQLSGVFDVEDPIPGNYNLEISSPGLDRPLFKASDYQRFAGNRVKVKLARSQNGRKNFKGVLQGVDNDQVILEIEGQEVRLSLADIEQSRLIPKY